MVATTVKPKSGVATPRLAARRRAVHAACRQLGMDEETRRDMLQNVAGVRSTTLLNLDACDKVLDHLHSRGAALNPKMRNVGNHPGTPETHRPGCGALIGKIEAQLASMKLPWKYALSILKNISADKRAGKPGVDKLEWATPDHLHKVVAALDYEQKKRWRLATVDEILSTMGKTRDDAAALVAIQYPSYKRDWTRDKKVLTWLANYLADAP